MVVESNIVYEKFKIPKTVKKNYTWPSESVKVLSSWEVKVPKRVKIRIRKKHSFIIINMVFDGCIDLEGIENKLQK